MTGPELLALWDERDKRYAIRRAGSRTLPLSEREAESVRAFRYDEVEALPLEHRLIPSQVLVRWEPPHVGVR